MEDRRPPLSFYPSCQCREEMSLSELWGEPRRGRHRKETEAQIERLDKAFELLDHGGVRADS